MGSSGPETGIFPMLHFSAGFRALRRGRSDRTVVVPVTTDTLEWRPRYIKYLMKVVLVREASHDGGVLSRPSTSRNIRPIVVLQSVTSKKVATTLLTSPNPLAERPAESLHRYDNYPAALPRSPARDSKLRNLAFLFLPRSRLSRANGYVIFAARGAPSMVHIRCVRPTRKNISTAETGELEAITKESRRQIVSAGALA